MRSKYNAQKTIYNGVKFDSKKEANYCAKLDMLKKATGNDKVISYELQPRYDIIVNEKKIGFYKADFKVLYRNRVEVIDVKGFKTDVYKIKKKLVEAIYGIKIIEV